MSWPRFSPYEMMRTSMSPVPSPVPGGGLPGAPPIPEAPPGLGSVPPGPTPGSLAPVVPAGLPNASLPTRRQPSPQLAREANPAPRFDPDAEMPNDFLGNLFAGQPMQGVLPSEEVRARRMGIGTAAAAIGLAADSGRGFVGSVMAGILAGHKAAEENRMRYAEARLAQGEPGEEGVTVDPTSRESIMQGLSQVAAGSPEWDKLSSALSALNKREKEAEAQALIARHGGDLMAARDEAKAMGDLPLVRELTEVITSGRTALGSDEVIKDLEGEEVMSGNPVGRFRNYTGTDANGNHTYQVLGSRGEDLGFSITEKAPVNLAADSPVERFNKTIFNGTLENFRTKVGEGTVGLPAYEVMGNLKTGFAESALKSLSDYIEYGDPGAEHPQIFSYMTGLDGSVVREGEVKLMQSIGAMLNLPENFIDQFMEGTLVSEEARLGMVLFARVKGARAAILSQEDRDFMELVGERAEKSGVWGEFDVKAAMGANPFDGLEDLLGNVDSQVEEYLRRQESDDQAAEDRVAEYREMLKKAGMVNYGFN